MRIFELITGLILIVVYLERIFKKVKSEGLWNLMVIVPLFLHIILEGIRWQMFGLYLLSLLIVIQYIYVCFIKIRQTNGSVNYKKFGNIMCIILVLLSLVLLQVLPVSNLATPLGPYQVGTISYDLIDNNRLEIYGDQEGQQRKIRLQMWYPTEDSYSGEKALWLEDGKIVSRGLLDVYGIPNFLFDHLTLIESNGYIDAPLNTELDQLPVVIISHGWTGFRDLHTDIGEMFASLGYLAISVDHTYGSVGLVFEDGESVGVDQNALPNRQENDDFDTYATNLVDTYSKDSGLVIDHLEEIASGVVNDYVITGELTNDLKMFEDRINLNQIGVIGHSTGGGGIVELALNDDRVQVVIGLDPWIEPLGETILEAGLDQEAMFFRSSQWAGGINDEYVKILAQNEENQPRIYEIAGSYHQDFSMVYQFGPIPRWIGMSGEMKGEESAEILNTFIMQFMNQYLLDIDTEIESLVDQYDDVNEVFHTN